MQLILLSPPYAELQRLDSQVVPKHGSIMCATDAPAARALVGLVEVLFRFPWVVPCAAVNTDEAPTASLLARLIPQMDTRLATVARIPTSPVLPGHVAASVRHRPGPTPEVMARYVTDRLQAPELDHLLTLQFRQALSEQLATACVSLATFSRTFRRYGRWSAKDWRAIARLALALSRRGSAPPPSPLTFSRHCRKYLAVASSQALSMVGWEWAVEATLYAGGYLSRPARPAEPPMDRRSNAVAG